MQKPYIHIPTREIRDEFLFEYNLTAKDISYKHRPPNSIQEWNSNVFSVDKKGNLIIPYPSLDGGFETHPTKDGLKDSYRIRFKHPFLNKEGKEVKYNMVGKNCIYFPPDMVKAYQAGTKIPTLIVTEGEKKAFVASKKGFDVVAISGIWNFLKKDQEGESTQAPLMPELKEFLKKCQVESLVLLHDSDALDCTLDIKKSATARPFLFYSSVKRFAELTFQCGVQFYYSYINPKISTKKLGLDDLIRDYEDYNQRVLFDFYDSVENKKFTEFFCTTKIEFIKDSFIKGIFHLNEPSEFYNYHKQALENRDEFLFENRRFKIDKIEKTLEEVKNNSRQNVWENKGCYYGYDQRGNTKLVANFTMKVLFLLKSNVNPKRIVRFHNDIGQNFIQELTMDDFVSVSSFRKKIIAHGSFVYFGETFELLNLQKMLFADEEPATEITSLGWQKNYSFWAWANGITYEGKFYPVNEFGITSFETKSFYLPAFSSLFDDADEKFENERNFKHIDSNISFKKWASTFYGTYKNNGIIGISYFIAALYRDIIFPEFKEFPILNLFGQKGSGKSTMAKSLMYLFGNPQPAISLENASSTKKGIFRKFSQYRSAFIWLDEYKNSIHPDLIGLVKNLYDGIGYERAQTSQDNRTISQPVSASTILSGQDMPTIDPALFTRVLLLMFKNNAFADADVVNYNELKKMEKAGLTAITNMLLTHRDLIERNFVNEFNRHFKHLAKLYKYKDIPDRLIKNAALVMAPTTILMNEQLIDFPITENQLTAMFTDMLEQHLALMADNQEVSQFWQIIENLFDEGIVSFDNGDFRFIESTIAIRYNRLYTLYAEKYRKMFGRNGLDKMTLDNYLKNTPEYIESKDGIRFNKTVTSGYIFKYKDLGINLSKSALTEDQEKDLKNADAPEKVETDPF